MTYDLETLNIFIYAFFALAAVSAVFAAVSVPMVLRRPTRRPTLQLVSATAGTQAATATAHQHAA